MLWVKTVALVILGELLVVAPAVGLARAFVDAPRTKHDYALAVDLPRLASDATAYHEDLGALPARQRFDWPADPWDRMYLYEPQDRAARFASLGRDGVPGGQGEDADMEVWIAFPDR